jgi:hypothetical protein
MHAARKPTRKRKEKHKNEMTPPTPCMIRFSNKIIQIGQIDKISILFLACFQALSRHHLSSLTIHVWQAGFPADFAVIPVAHASCATHETI